MAKYFDNVIDVFANWAGDDSTGGLPVRGRRVREAIQSKLRELMADKAGDTYFDTGNMRMLTFASADDCDQWRRSGDESLILRQHAVNFSSRLRRIVITNLSGGSQMYYTTAADKAEIKLSFASQDKDITDPEWSDTPEDYTVSVYVDRGAKGSFVRIADSVFVPGGSIYAVDLRKWLDTGDNRVRVQVTGTVSEETATLGLSATLTSMYLREAEYAWWTPFVEGQPYALGGVNIGGALDKTLKIRVSNDAGYERLYQIALGSQVYTTNPYYFSGLEFPGATGVYKVELWLEADNLVSDRLTYNIMCVAASDRNTARLVAISEFAAKAVNFADNTLFRYAVYNGGRVSADPHVTLAVYAGPNRSEVVNETLVGVATGEPLTYTRSVEIEGVEEDATLGVIMEWGNNISHTYAIDNSAAHPAAAGAAFSLNPSNRSNAQANREKVVNDRDKSEVTAIWAKMAWTDGTDGWTLDANGRKCLLLPARTRCTLDLTPLSSIGTGKTVEFVYMVSNASNYDDAIISIASNPADPKFRGLRISPDKILLHSRDLNTDDANQQYSYGEDTLMQVAISIIPNYKINYGNLAVIYVNGVRKKEFAYSPQDSWLTDAKVILGSDTADLMLYGMRVYDRGFGTQDALLNYAASLPLPALKDAEWKRLMSVCDDSFAIDYDKTLTSANVMEIEMLDGELPHYGLSKSYKAKCNVTFRWHGHPEWTITITNVTIEGQGTTSMNYFVWNNRWRLDKDSGFVIKVFNAEGMKVGEMKIELAA